MKSGNSVLKLGISEVSKDWRHYGLVVLIVALTASAIYSNTFHVPFVFDDHHAIRENLKVRDLHNFAFIDLLRSPRSLVDLTFALNYHFGELQVMGFHLVNLLIHILNGILVFALSRSLFKKLLGTENAISFDAAVVSALIFIAHPLQTQAITYISQRYTSMSAFFYLSAVLTYLRARDAQLDKKTAPCLLYYISCVLCGLLAFLCKQNAASLPIAILLIEYAVYDRNLITWLKKIAFFLPVIFLCGLFYAYNMGMFHHEVNLSSLLDDVWDTARETQNLSRWRYFCTQFGVVTIYIRLLFVPIHQSLDYRYPFNNGFFEGVTPYAFVFLLFIIGAGWWCRRKQPIVFLSIFWFFITLSVESSLIPIRDALFEHRLYLPMFGFSLLLGYGALRLFQVKRMAAYGAALLIVSMLSITAYQRNEVWQDDKTLWSDAAVKNPNNFRALTNLGIALQERGDVNGAMAAYNAAIKLRPNYYIALYNKSRLLSQIGRKDASLAVLQDALRYNPADPKILINMGVATARKGELDKAVEYFQKAESVRPDIIEAYVNLATIYANTGKLDLSVDQYLKALHIETDNAKLHNSIGVVYYKLKKYDDAAYHFREAIRLDPNASEAYLNLGNLQVDQNKTADAVQTYNEFIRLNPKAVEGHTNLGAVLMRTGETDKAIQQFDAAVKINPDAADLRINLGKALYYTGKISDAMEQFGIALRLKPTSPEIINEINSVIRSRENTQK